MLRLSVSQSVRQMIVQKVHLRQAFGELPLTLANDAATLGVLRGAELTHPSDAAAYRALTEALPVSGSRGRDRGASTLSFAGASQVLAPTGISSFPPPGSARA